jgi:hypothetical protein
MDTTADDEISALRERNQARLNALAAAGATLDTVSPYLIIMLEGIAEHLGILPQIGVKYERTMDAWLDDAEREIARRNVKKLFGS